MLRSLPDHPLLDRIIRGRAWIPILGLMLGGIVALQVELLKLNAATGRSIQLVSALQSRNDILRAEVSAASDPGRIERLAKGMGMIMPGPESITFLTARSAIPRRALAGIRLPDMAAFEAALQATNATSTVPGITAPAAPAAAVSTQSTTQASPGTGSTAPASGTGTSTATSAGSSSGSAGATQTAGPPATVP